jgi:hypothetical protein
VDAIADAARIVARRDRASLVVERRVDGGSAKSRKSAKG